jgi:hypothetical protein
MDRYRRASVVDWTMALIQPPEEEQMPIVKGRVLATSLTAVVVGTVAVLAPATPAFAATWAVVATPNASVNDNILIGTDAVAANNVWAVGRADHAKAPFRRPLVARWNGTAWSLVSTRTSPAPIRTRT